MFGTLVAWIRFTRRAQRLAELQMDFVAGVSHELRTPLTVIHTAAYNLQGGVASDPAQVERYGALIQQESGRLKQTGGAGAALLQGASRPYRFRSPSRVSDGDR